MAGRRRVIVLSDIHYAGASEKVRGWREAEFISNPALRSAVRAYRHYIWRRDPFAHNYLLDRFCGEVSDADAVIANGDFSCDTAFVGVSDRAACQSAVECLDRLRERYGTRFCATIGDHELGKRSLFGGEGGMRLASWSRTIEDLALEPFWVRKFGRCIMIGVTSSLLALPVYLPETLPEEQPEWERLRGEHLSQIRSAFDELSAENRVVLFCHDPTAIPFLWREKSVRSRLNQITLTVIGHLHSRLYLWQSRILSGMPTIAVLGYSIRRMSAALREARHWRPFQVRLCPALAGIELLKDGGYCSFEFSDDDGTALNWRFHSLPWNSLSER